MDLCTYMKTISSAVEDYIKSKPFLVSALTQGIINLTSLARMMNKDITSVMNKDVRNGAIVMALKRLSSDFEFRSSLKIVRTLRNIGDITVRSSLIDYNFKTSPTLLTSQAKLMAEISGDKDNFYTSSRGVNECNVVVSGNLAELVESCFSNETCIHKEMELSSISVKLPIENVSVPGIYYFVFQRLSWEGINIYEVISTSNEFTILVNEEQVDKAFRIIKDLKQL